MLDNVQMPDAAPEQQTAQAPETQSAQPQAPSVTDLDALNEFRFQGKSYTPEGLAKLFQEHQTYAEHSKYKEYADNVHIDLKKLLKDPSLADEFKQVYPKQFHHLVDILLGQTRQDASQKSQTSGLPDEVLQKITGLEDKLSKYERMSHEAEVAKHDAYLQKVVDPLFEKYGYAVPDAVWAKAESLLKQGYQMNDAAWERLIKENHAANEKRFESRHQAKLKEQLEKGNKAKDTGAGGSAPGQAPPRIRTFSDAREAMLKELGGS